MTPRFERRLYQVALGKRIRDARDNKRITQAVLAHKAGYAPQTIGNIERGTTMPSITVVFTFAAVLDVDPKTLFFGPEE